MNGFKLNQLPTGVKTGIVCYLALVLMVLALPFYMMSQKHEGHHAAQAGVNMEGGSIAYADEGETEEAEEGEQHHRSAMGGKTEEVPGDEGEVSQHSQPPTMNNEQGGKEEGAEQEVKGEGEEHEEGGEELLKMAHVHLGGHTLLLFTVGLLFALTTLSCSIKGAVFVVSSMSVALHTIGLVLMPVLGKGLVGGSMLVYVLSILFMAAVVVKDMFASKTSA